MRHTPRRLGWLALVMLALACETAGSGGSGARPGEKSEEQKALDAFYDEQKEAITKRSRAWQAAIEKARVEAVHRTATGACPHRVDPTFTGIDKSMEELGIETLPSLSGSPSLFVKAPELRKMLSPRGRSLMKHLLALKKGSEDYAPMSAAKSLETAKALAGESYWTWDVAMVVDLEQKATNVDLEEGTFEGGTILGTVYVYDYAADRIVCAGAFAATSSESLTVKDQAGEFEGKSAVDLDMNAAKRAIASLKAVPSPSAAPAPSASASAP